VNARGTEALVERARSSGTKRFLYLSNAAVYGYAVHRNAKETEVTVDPATAISRSRVRAEQTVLENNGIVLRPLFVYGHGDSHFIPVLIKALERFPFMIDGGKARLSVISVDDLAEVIVNLATDEWSRGYRGVFHVDDGHPVSFKEIAVSLAACVGSRLPSLSMPLFLAQSVMRLAGRGIFQKSGMRSSSHRLFLVARDHYYDTSKLWNLISVKPGPSLQDGLGRYNGWYRRFVHAERKG
jgi:nucleoside-diphosphate-sugar epimerase